MRRPAGLGAALLALGLLAGCGGGIGNDDGGTSTTATVAKAPQRVIVQTSADGFNPAQVYEEAAPGVVTVRSIFDAGAAEGSGFVLDTDGRIVTNAHVVTEDPTTPAGSGSGRRPSTSSSPTATWSRRRSSASTPSPTSP